MPPHALDVSAPQLVSARGRRFVVSPPWWSLRRVHAQPPQILAAANTLTSALCLRRSIVSAAALHVFGSVTAAGFATAGMSSATTFKNRFCEPESRWAGVSIEPAAQSARAQQAVVQQKF